MRPTQKTKKFTRTRICLKEKSFKTKKEALELLPNCPIRFGRLSLNSHLPQQQKSLQKKKAYKKLTANSAMIDFLSINAAKLESSFHSIGQLVTIFVLKQSKASKYKKKLSAELVLPQFNYSSNFLFELVSGPKKALLIGGCLHSLQNRSPELLQLIKSEKKNIKSTDYDFFTIFTKGELDISTAANKVHKILLQKLRRVKRNKYEPSQLKELFMFFMRRRYARDSFLEEIFVKNEFLIKRKNFIKKCADSKTGLLDPKFGLQPLPSVDICFYGVGEGFEPRFRFFLSRSYYYVNKKEEESWFGKKTQNLEEEEISEASYSNISNCSLPTNFTFPPCENSNKFFTKISTQSPEQLFSSIKFLKIDAETFIKNSEVEIEQKAVLCGYQGVFMDCLGYGLSKPRCKTFSHFLDGEVINEDLSLSGCIIKEKNNELLTFFGNTSGGSSGAPLLSSNLDILGVNFGYYTDYDEECGEHDEEQVSLEKFVNNEQDSVFFDLNVPENYKKTIKEKDRNLAVKITHPVVKNFFEEALDKLEENSNKNLEKFGNLSLNINFQNFKKEKWKSNQPYPQEKKKYPKKLKRLKMERRISIEETTCSLEEIS